MHADCETEYSIFFLMIRLCLQDMLFLKYQLCSLKCIYLLLVGRKLCCATVKSLFTNEGKHGGEVTVEAVQMIADLVKASDCQLHPDSIEVCNFNTDTLVLGYFF